MKISNTLRINHLRAIFALIAALAGIPTTNAADDTNTNGDWKELPALPDANGFAGMYAGTSGNTLLVAGGANFPDKKPWEGGTKVWYDTVYALDSAKGPWRIVGKLPQPMGYGVSLTVRDKMYIVGGCNATGHFDKVYQIELQGGTLKTTELPPLPKPRAYACGALVGDNFLVVAGGQEKPDATEASSEAYALDIKAEKPEWKTLPPLPGPGRILAMAASSNSEFFVFGGASLSAGPDGKPVRKYLADGHMFFLEKWFKIPDMPHALAAAPGPCPIFRSTFFVVGGDDGTQVGTQPDQHKGFSGAVLKYESGHWTNAGNVPAPRATAPVTQWNGEWVFISGEVRPGIRSPQVWSFKPNWPQLTRKRVPYFPPDRGR